MATQTPNVDAPAPRGLFTRGANLVVSYVRMHPGPFAISVAGSLVFAVASILLTEALARSTDEVLRPAFEGGGVEAKRVWLSVAALMFFARSPPRTSCAIVLMLRLPPPCRLA